MVLRGGEKSPNYYPEDIAKTTKLLKQKKLPSAIMVDCSHANSYKDHRRQGEVLENVVAQLIENPGTISGVMIESNLKAGNQIIPEDLSQLKFGVSITDECVDWETTVQMLTRAFTKLAER
jgi:3-deoxy-7-phosphoheptulonate synthase